MNEWMLTNNSYNNNYYNQSENIAWLSVLSYTAQNNDTVGRYGTYGDMIQVNNQWKEE
jgi:hypothetical protein